MGIRTYYCVQNGFGHNRAVAKKDPDPISTELAVQLKVIAGLIEGLNRSDMHPAEKERRRKQLQSAAAEITAILNQRKKGG